MGVAMVVSVDVANHSAARAFQYSMNAVAGKATHQIVGGSKGIPDSFYTHLRVKKGISNIAPVIEAHVTIPDSGRSVFKLLGVDFLAERPFRNYLSRTEFSIDGQLKDFLTSPNSIILSSTSLKVLKKSKGDSIPIIVNGKKKSVHIIGLIHEEEQNSAALENLIISDIASAQELTEKGNNIDYIDVILSDKEHERHLKNILPKGFELQQSGARSKTTGQMLEAFNINLTALSLLALIVGLFLIYNTMTFSVVQRKVLFGILRSIGVTGKEISWMIVKEAFLISVIGTALGFLIGITISRFLIILVSQTINDLYFVLAVRDIYISQTIIFKGLSLGIIAPIFSTLQPAQEKLQRFALGLL
jgi:putative ABC transport system permease protein